MIGQWCVFAFLFLSAKFHSLFINKDSKEIVRLPFWDQQLINFCMHRRWWRIPQLSEFISAYYGSFAELNLFGRRIVFITNYSLAKKMMMSYGNSFLQRFGDDRGLGIVGMYRRGLIWNNDTDAWQRNRRIYEMTVNRGIDVLQEKAEKYLNGLSIDLCKPISILYILRRFTLSMTLECLFGISANRFDEAWKVNAIATVGGYFSAWEFFLLNPNASEFEPEASAHKKSIQAMHALGAEIYEASRGESEFTAALDKLGDRDETVQNVCELLLAGTDTSSLTMFYTL
jgi:cytochrome P450